MIWHDDQKGTIMVKVYYPKKNIYAWVDEQLVTRADRQLDLIRRGKVKYSFY
jgi:hypothetical protein